MFVTHAWALAGLFFITLALIGSLPHSTWIEWTLTIATVLVIGLGPLRDPVGRMRSIQSAREFASASDAVDRFARAHPGADLYVNLPGIEGLDVPSRNPAAWTNTLMARYYGVRSIAWRPITARAALAPPPQAPR